MTDQISSYTRSKQVLQLLKSYGPLSFRSLHWMMRPSMNERRLHDAIARLCRNGFIQRRHHHLFRGAGVFYQVTQAKEKRNAIAKKLECSSNTFGYRDMQYFILKILQKCGYLSSRHHFQKIP